MSNADENRAIVRKFFASGFGSEVSRALVTDDFRWVGPASLNYVFDHDVRASAGPESLTDLSNVAAALYKASHADSTNVRFMIAEGDVVVLEFEATRMTFDDESYRNSYCLVFFMRSGKITEVHEHVDTHHTWDLCFSTRDKMDGVRDRLKCLRDA